MTDQQITQMIDAAMKSKVGDIGPQSFDNESVDDLRSLEKELKKRGTEVWLDRDPNKPKPHKKGIQIHELCCAVIMELKARKNTKEWAMLTEEQRQRRRQRLANKNSGIRRRHYDAEKARAYYEANKEQIIDQVRSSRYGITREQFLALDAEQDGRCAICKMPFTATGTTRRHLDHDHAIGGKVRGLLCASCNLGIGHFNDDSELLRAAAAYLERRLLDPAKPEPTKRERCRR
jgi:hypothetical protein